MLQPRKITKIFLVSGDINVGEVTPNVPTELERVRSFVYWAAWKRNRRTLIKGSGHINQSAIAKVMELDAGHLSRVLISGEDSPWGRKVLEGLGRLAAKPEGPIPSYEVEYQIREGAFHPYPVEAFKPSKRKGKKKRSKKTG